MSDKIGFLGSCTANLNKAPTYISGEKQSIVIMIAVLNLVLKKIGIFGVLKIKKQFC
ncbi:hypothetical protein [uncultured Thiothrix sp.]|uniref:hypothetical protein n=1 Tax=uncultured Thiothrix sp. TaxID=223185 RepID=UPI0026218D39|nr:hypothetical protein [uncultured Thiothrix sp.]